MLSQARLPSAFFVWADEIVAYLSRTAAATAGFAAIRIVSTHRFKGVRAGETGNIHRNRRVTMAHGMGVIGKNLISTPANSNRNKGS